jgi:hypothetical protein
VLSNTLIDSRCWAEAGATRSPQSQLLQKVAVNASHHALKAPDGFSVLCMAGLSNIRKIAGLPTWVADFSSYSEDGETLGYNSRYSAGGCPKHSWTSPLRIRQDCISIQGCIADVVDSIGHIRARRKDIGLKYLQAVGWMVMVLASSCFSWFILVCSFGKH